MVLPATSPALRTTASARDNHALPRRAILESQTEFLLSRVLQREIDYQRMVHDSQVDLSTRHDFTVAASFEAIDSRAPKGKIDRFEIQDFTRDYIGAALTPADLDAVVRRVDVFSVQVALLS